MDDNIKKELVNINIRNKQMLESLKNFSELMNSIEDNLQKNTKKIVADISELDRKLTENLDILYKISTNLS